MMKSRVDTPRRLLGGVLTGLGLIAALATTAAAQTSTGTIRGTVTGQDGQPLADAQVAVRNPASGVQRGTLTRADGGYTVPGLSPATYEVTVRRIGSAPQTRVVVVQIGATQIENFNLASQATELTTVAVTAAPVAETRTSEVATNVTEAQIENLPTPSRNFLDLAALQPGITVTEDRVGGQFRTFSGGGQSASSVNVFIDGTSLKNDLTAGGVAGQDASRGNPFPRNAIQEYRVIGQNFKAEYQKSSSAIITATTKSGTNQFEGNAFVTYQHAGLVELDSFQRRDRNNNPSGFVRPDYKRTLYGLSLSGPIIRDRMHFFGSFESNRQDRSNRVSFAAPPTGFEALDTVNLLSYNGQFNSPFREQMFFGKLNYSINERSGLEASFSLRDEDDVRDFGGNRAFVAATNFQQNVSIAQLKHQYFIGALLNEAKVDFSNFRRRPSANQPGLLGRRFYYPGGEAYVGSAISEQDYIQRRIGIRDDVTYSGFQMAGEHIIKGGASIDFVTYDILKFNDRTPDFRYSAAEGGQPYDFRSPFLVRYGTGDAAVKTNNQQVGLYIQDDWSPVRRLTLNLGVRWDYETKMLNHDYRTPQNAIDTLTRYNDQLITPLDLDRYISRGDGKPFMGAIQPRAGFSYAFDERSRTTVFGGWGLYYDRVPFDLYAVDPQLKLSHPTYEVRFAPRDSTPRAGQIAWSDAYLTADRDVLDALVTQFGRPEAWFIDNEMKVPKSTQMNLGVRQLLGTVAVSVTYQNVHAEDLPILNWANFGLNDEGRCCTSFDIGAHGFSNFIYSTNDKETWYEAVSLQVDRPYSRRARSSIGWGAGLAYTYATRELAGADNLGDDFAFPASRFIPRHPSNDEKHRVVANWITDLPYLFGIQFSGLATLGGKYRQDVGCNARFCPAPVEGEPLPNEYERGAFTVPGTFPYRVVDIRFRKGFPTFGRDARGLGVTLDVFNVFNRDNLGCYQTGNRLNNVNGELVPNPNFGQPSCVVTDARRYQLGAELDF